MNIQLSGFSSEIQQLLTVLSSIPGITITRESREYPNRNSQCVRQYIDIEFPLGNDCPKFPGASEKGDAQ